MSILFERAADVIRRLIPGSAEPAAPKVATLDDATSRVAACEAVHAECLTRATKASRAQDEAKAKLDAATTERERAERKAEESGSESDLSAFVAKQAAETFAARRHTTAADEASRAHSAAATAAAAVDSARAEVEMASRLAALNARADLASYRAKAAENARAAFGAIATLRAALESTDAAFEDVNAASAELRSLGYDVPDLDVIHRVAELLLLASERDPELLTIVDGDDRLHRVRHRFQGVNGPKGLAAVLLESVDLDGLFVRAYGRGHVPADRADGHRACLNAALRGRSIAEVQQAKRDHRFRHGCAEEIQRRRRANEAPPEGCAFPDLEPVGGRGHIA